VAPDPTDQTGPTGRGSGERARRAVRARRPALRTPAGASARPAHRSRYQPASRHRRRAQEVGERHGPALLLVRRPETDEQVVHFSNGTSQFVTWVGEEDQRDVVRESVQTWKAIGIGLEFEEVDDRSEAEVRIGFMRFDGSWSAVGRDVLLPGANSRTTNYGWDLTTRTGTPRRCTSWAMCSASPRASEPLRRHRLGRAESLRILPGAAEQLGPRHDVLERAPEAEPLRRAWLLVGPRLDHGILIPTRVHPVASPIPRRRSQPAGHDLARRQAVHPVVVPGDGAGRAAHAEPVRIAGPRAHTGPAGGLRHHTTRHAQVLDRHVRVSGHGGRHVREDGQRPSLRRRRRRQWDRPQRPHRRQAVPGTDLRRSSTPLLHVAVGPNCPRVRSWGSASSAAIQFCRFGSEEKSSTRPTAAPAESKCSRSRSAPQSGCQGSPPGRGRSRRDRGGPHGPPRTVVVHPHNDRSRLPYPTSPKRRRPRPRRSGLRQGRLPQPARFARTRYATHARRGGCRWWSRASPSYPAFLARIEARAADDAPAWRAMPNPDHPSPLRRPDHGVRRTTDAPECARARWALRTIRVAPRIGCAVRLR
jgi:hypothetical protein